MSTKGSIEFIELELDGYIASVHVYEECMDDGTQVYIESWIQGDDDNYCEAIVVRKDVWESLVKALKG